MTTEERAAEQPTDEAAERIRRNLGTRRVAPLRLPVFPDAGAAVRHLTHSRPPGAVDVLLVNPPSPDGAIWIRTQHRVGRRSREEMVWPQCSLAQHAAMLQPDYTVDVIDAIAERMTWKEFEQRLREKAPKYYFTQCTAPTLTNDMYGAMLAKSLGATTIAFGTHVTAMPTETLRDFPALDLALCGEPELTFREAIDVLEGRQDDRPEWVQTLLEKADSSWQPTSTADPQTNGHAPDLTNVKGLVWRDRGAIRKNAPRPFIPDLNDLPVPLYELLPFDKYRMPLMKGPFSFVVTERGCTAGCRYCIKHVSYNWTVRLLSPERIMKELWLLDGLGIRNIHMYADLFTVNREQVMELCRRIIDEGLKIKWTCNSRVDYVDEEMLSMMGRAGCWMISWGIESGNEMILKRAAKGADPKGAPGIDLGEKRRDQKLGLLHYRPPRETPETIRETIDFSKSLPLELALFHIAAPYPGTPFFFEVVEKGWFREGTRWEEVDMDRGTVLQYENLSADDLMYWQKRAFREWALRPGPAWTYLKMLFSDTRTFKRAVRVGAEHFRWATASS